MTREGVNGSNYQPLTQPQQSLHLLRTGTTNKYSKNGSAACMVLHSMEGASSVTYSHTDFSITLMQQYDKDGQWRSSALSEIYCQARLHVQETTGHTSRRSQDRIDSADPVPTSPSKTTPAIFSQQKKGTTQLMTEVHQLRSSCLWTRLPYLKTCLEMLKFSTLAAQMPR